MDADRPTTLDEVLAGVRFAAPPALSGATRVAGLDYDSRRIQPGFLFFAFPGSRADGRDFARAAAANGALAVVSDMPAAEGCNAPWIQVERGREALAIAARNFYGRPDARLGLTGITGTNGKTTTAFLIDGVLRSAGHVTALVGTIEYRVAAAVRPAVNTTPESLDLYRLFAELEGLGGSHVTMEVSSHALALGRVHGIAFHTAVFTNLTRDHLDFHKTMEDYFAAKQLLFTPRGGPPPQWAVINGDDERGRALALDRSTRAIRYGFAAGAELRASDLAMTFAGLRFQAEYQGEKTRLESPLTGKINAYNILAACGAALSYGLDWKIIQPAIAGCSRVPGRFENIEAGQPFLVVVDYAHTDDALRNLISIARELSPKRVITLFGCGGDRDRAKRPLMGMAAGQASDFVVLTSDNPRSEDPLDIINDALVGLRRFDTPHLIEPDRQKAIRLALREARPGDIVLIAGKGHEPYQILNGRSIAFDDREAARAALHSLGYTASGGARK